MIPVVSMSAWRSPVTAWARRHLLVQRALPLAVLILWACLMMLGFLIHPDPPGSQPRQGSLPLLTAGGAGIDYYQFWVVGRARGRLHLDNIYSMSNRQRLAELGRELAESTPQPSTRLAECVKFRGSAIETFSTPFLYAVVGAFASGQYERDYDRFMRIGLVALLLSVIALGWLVRFSLVESLLFVAVLVLWSEPLASDLRVGNVNQLELAGVALYLGTRLRPGSLRMDLLGGAVLGLLVAFKPTLGVIPILLAVAWIIDRRGLTLRRQGIAAAVAAGLAFVAGCLFLNSWSAWWDWVRALPDLEKMCDLSVEIGNCSLSQMILEATGGQAGGGSGLSTILLILGLGLAGAALFRTRPGAPGAENGRQVWFERDFVVTAVACALSVLALRLVWLHYYILLVPLLFHVLRPGAGLSLDAPAGREPRSRSAIVGLVLAWLTLAIVLGGPLTFLIGSEAFRVSTALSIAGGWGLVFLGLAGLWRPSSTR